MLLDLNTDFSGGRSGSQVVPSLKEFSTVCCDPHKGFSKVNEAEVDVFLEFSFFFYYPADVGKLISGSSAFSKTSLNIRKFMGHVLLKPGLENFECYFSRPTIKDVLSRTVMQSNLYMQSYPFKMPFNGFRYTYSMPMQEM